MQPLLAVVLLCFALGPVWAEPPRLAAGPTERDAPFTVRSIRRHLSVVRWAPPVAEGGAQG